MYRCAASAQVKDESSSRYTGLKRLKTIRDGSPKVYRRVCAPVFDRYRFRCCRFDCAFRRDICQRAHRRQVLWRLLDLHRLPDHFHQPGLLGHVVRVERPGVRGLRLEEEQQCGREAGEEVNREVKPEAERGRAGEMCQG